MMPSRGVGVVWPPGPPSFDGGPLRRYAGGTIGRATMEPQIRFCTSADGTRIAYTTLGDGPPLLSIPAWLANLTLDLEHPVGQALFERISERRLVVLADCRGAGSSEREVSDVSLDARVADIKALADHLHLDRFDLWGNHDGAVVSAVFAAMYPKRVSRLVLLAPYARGEDVVAPGPARSLGELMRQNWSLARRAFADICFPEGPTDFQRWISSYFRQSVNPEMAAEHYGITASLDAREYLPQVKAPTLVLHRRGDRMVPMAAGKVAASMIPDARFVALEGTEAGRYPGDMSYVDTMLRFLDEDRTVETAAEVPEAGAFRTVLFTDVEGSTALTQRLGDARARELLREHERLVREALKSHGGAEVKTMGDGFMASFTSATGALECAIAMQRAFAAHKESAEEPIKVRVGLNAGEPIAEEDPEGRSDLFGTAVNEAARITATAKGGEILVSDVVRQLAKGKDFLFADRGEASLKGFDEPVRLYEVRWRESG